MYLMAEHLPTIVTCEISNFIVWLQQMWLELVTPRKTVWTVSTWVRLCTSVNINMTLQFIICLKQHSTVRTLMWSLACCVYNVYVSASWWTGWNFCYTTNICTVCTVCLACVLSCFCRCSDWLNALSHTRHLYGLSPVWTLMCVCRFPEWLNALSHTWHLYGLSPVWTLMCVCRFPEWLNALSHTRHLYGLSPVWTLMCVCLCPVWLNALSHTRHLYGLSRLQCGLSCVSADFQND